MSWTTRETAARKSLGVGVSWTFDRVMDMTHGAYSALSELFVKGLYYVDEENGAAGNSGTSPDDAFNTITLAVDACKNDYDDDALYYIFVAPGNYVEDDIQFYGHGIHMIGLGVPGRDSGVHLLGESATNGVLYVAAANGEIANMCIEAAGVKPCIYGEVAENVWIHDCVFHGKTGTTLDLLKFDSLCNSTIERNRFLTFEQKGIYFTGAANHFLIESKIKDNMFAMSATGTIGSGAKGIFVHAGVKVYGTVIDHNWILMGGVAGSPKGIDCDATSMSGSLLITDNYVQMPSGGTAIENAMAINGMLHNHTALANTVTEPNPGNSG